MRSRLTAALLTACACLLSQGCTYRAWYEGLQERQRQACYKNSSPGEIQDCISKVNSKTYDEYEEARKSALKQYP
jgi:hypothetical protein